MIVHLHVKKFPLLDEQVQAVLARGGIVDDVTFAQEVIFVGGAKIVHGTELGDGLHTGEESVFE